MPKIKLSSLKPSKPSPPSGKEITSVAEAMHYVDYKQWFSNSYAISYVGDFQRRYANASSEQKTELVSEAENVLTVYSVLVYLIYPKLPEFKKTVDSNKEFSANFSRIKTWLEGHNGKQVAQEFAANIDSALDI